MRCASWVVATSMVTSLGACSLTTSLSGLSNGDAIEAPGGSDASATEAATSDGGTETGTGTDTGTSADAGAASYRAVVLFDAPLAYYRLGDQGTTAKDEVGAHDGVYKGMVTHAAGAIAGDTNGAAVFDGASGYVDVGDALPFLVNAPFSVEAWVSPVSGATDPMCIASKSFAQGGLNGSITDGYTFYLDRGSNALNVARYLSGIADAVQGGAAVNGTFAHVVATYDGGRLTIWLDGVSVASDTSARKLVSHAQPLTIGASRGGIYCYFRGALDEVAFYGAALSGDRIRAHHDAGRGK